MPADLWSLHRQMLRSRLFEEAARELWNEGKISGEMHLGIGEEAIVAGILDHLREDDAMSLDHRGTPPMIMRGVDPVLILKEFLGHSDGLCSGMGGHMHLFSKEHLAASSGIVGASGPAAAGFALAARYLRPGTVSAAFFGEGAMNQGMMLESLNLAAIWELPMLFVCKDSEWAITTLSETVTAGKLTDRARGFGMAAVEVDGSTIEDVWEAARSAINRARTGEGPTFIHAHCVHPEGHFLGDPLLRVARHPVREMKQMAGPLLRSAVKKKGASLRERADSLASITSLIGKAAKGHYRKQDDPVKRTRDKLRSKNDRLQQQEEEVAREIQAVVETALQDR